MNDNTEKLQELWAALKAGKIVTVGGPKLTYEQQVAAYIRERYTVNDELALINNYNAYLADNSRAQYLAEYEAYQAYREECKNRAKGDS